MDGRWIILIKLPRSIFPALTVCLLRWINVFPCGLSELHLMTAVRVQTKTRALNLLLADTFCSGNSVTDWLTWYYLDKINCWPLIRKVSLCSDQNRAQKPEWGCLTVSKNLLWLYYVLLFLMTLIYNNNINICNNNNATTTTNNNVNNYFMPPF